MEWQVGQWVKCDGRLAKVHSVRSVMVHLSSHDGTMSWDRRKDDPLIKPFVWQVGKTYRTTLEGVTATITAINDQRIYGKTSDGSSLFPWLNDGTGCFAVASRDNLDAPHLLPFFADEPSEPKPASTEQQKLDTINPQHYRDHPSGIECIQVTEHMGYCIGNAIKYLWRAGKKGPAIEDLKKAAWYINREIERLTKGGA